MMKGSPVLLTLLLVSMLMTSCMSKSSADEAPRAERFYVSIGAGLVGELPPNNNAVEQAIEAYTGTDLQIQWIPLSAYDDKVRLMIASGELPKLIKLSNSPTYLSSLKAGQFWELGPLLQDYPNLSAPDRRYYDYIAVSGKIYGIPLFRDLGRAVIQYRKDWFDRLGLEVPVTLEDWYQVVRALTLDDPDRNGKNDTYGMVLEKRYNQDASSLLTRISVSQGGPNKWMVENGRFTPEFMTEPFLNTMKLFRRLYEEKLINLDFTLVDTIETAKIYDSGRAGIIVSGGNAQTWQDKLTKSIPGGIVDAAPLAGPGGVRLPGEPGNAGFLAIPKDAVKSESEVRRILKFLDMLLEPQMQTVIAQGVENRHWSAKDGYTEVLDRTLSLKEVKPYRDALLYLDEDHMSIEPVRQPELYVKNQLIGATYNNYIVPNPALTLESATNEERGKELEILISDAVTRFIMGHLDEAGWQAELAKWRQAGGDRMTREYEEAYGKVNQT
ncbi:putative aldouronate transport system substrate-binding protein [Paenibacillus phyllosphaerae]|uniref:Putative aldouronate transport system substrate-binding protein n=1 Tax=Paenibacillus phyllosphaerae TaxID=274593 RepID=A0A7W5FQ55_9BACL|nr:extracellular solute-binding protein [Paenibacillus phyllosphaerae]MBB3113126.1 putative aldouronate transport system substrate-binding protein [Paenibacillus phyllosphaerae]